MAIVTVGIDLANNIFRVHGVDESGKPAPLRLAVAGAKLIELIANLASYRYGHRPQQRRHAAHLLAIFAKQTKICP